MKHLGLNYCTNKNFKCQISMAMDVCEWLFLISLYLLLCIVTVSGTLRPIDERTCLPGYVCVHGYCKLPIQCICDPGWKLPFCDTSECDSECKNGTVCGVKNGTFDCIIGLSDSITIVTLGNDSTTVVTSLGNDSTTAVTSVANDSAKYDPILSSTYSTVILGCLNDTQCINGRCDTNEGRCVCEENWFGEWCDVQCPFKCFLPKVCDYQNGKFSCQMLNTTEDHSQYIGNTLETTTLSNPPRNVCSSDYLLRSEEERICDIVEFECVHGICTMERTTRRYEMECKCDTGSYGGRCEKICCMNCNHPNGNCRLNGTWNEYCECDYRYTGKYCQTKRPDENWNQQEDTSWTLWVVVIAVTVVICFGILFVGLIYYMWKHRVLMIMKIVHRFQSFEDGDDKKFDAFVSYRSLESDEYFVYRILYPKLEKELGFRLCLHHRDFIPGETIANNIIRAIKNSRRTIIVISPHYIRSGFTRFEYQVAQTEMLKRKHRIVPLLLEDIRNVEHEMDTNLRIIIESVTYIKWPGDNNKKRLEHFWKQLELSLPKKRHSSPLYPLTLSPSFPKLSNFDILESNSSQISKQEKSILFDGKDSESFYSVCSKLTDDCKNTSGYKHCMEDTII